MSIRGGMAKEEGTFIQWNITQPKKKKNDIQPFPTNTDGPRGYHAKTNTVITLWNLKHKTKEQI